MEPSNDGIIKPSAKATRKRLTFGQKLDILTRLEKGEKQHVLAKELGCSNRAISRLKQQRKFFEDLSLEASESHRKSWHTSRNAELEKPLTEFLETLKRTGFPIFSNGVRRAALKIRDELLADKNDVLQDRISLAGFQASVNWSKAFIKRKRLRGAVHGNNVGDKVSDGDTNAREAFTEKLKEYDVDYLMAVESFNIFYKLLPSDMATSQQAVSEEDAETCRKHDLKDRVVVLVACNTTGSFKIPATMIWKDDTGCCFRERGCGIPHLYHGYALLDTDVLKTWFITVLLPGIRQFTEKKVGVIVPHDWPDGMIDKQNQVEVIKAEFWRDSESGPLHGVSRHLRRKFRYGVAGVLQRLWKSGSGIGSGYGYLSGVGGLMKGECANLVDVSDLIGAGWRDITEEYVRNCWIQTGFLGEVMQRELGKVGEGEGETEMESGFDERIGRWLVENGVGRKEFDGWLRVEECARGVRGLCWEMDEMIRGGILKKVVGGRVVEVREVEDTEEDEGLPSLDYLMDLIHPIETVLVEGRHGKAASLIRQLRMELLRSDEQDSV